MAKTILAIKVSMTLKTKISKILKIILNIKNLPEVPRLISESKV